MNRLRVVLALALVALSLVAPAQTRDRTSAIWTIAGNRMIQQQDAWFEDGDFPACISILRMEAEKWTSDYDVWTNLGWMLENIQENDQALEVYKRYFALNPHDPDRSLPEATFYFMKKNYAVIPPLMEGHIPARAHPNNYRILAWSYERTKRYSDAVRIWKSYLAVNPTDAAAQRNLTRDEKRAAETPQRS